MNEGISDIMFKYDLPSLEVAYIENGWKWKAETRNGTEFGGTYMGPKTWQEELDREIGMTIVTDERIPKNMIIGIANPVVEDTTIYFNDEVDKIHAESLALMLKKRHDYGTRNLTFHGEFGILVRLMDKIMRLTNIHQSGKAAVQDESIRDSWIDVINYGVLGLLAHEDKLELPDRPENSTWKRVMGNVSSFNEVFNAAELELRKKEAMTSAEVVTESYNDITERVEKAQINWEEVMGNVAKNLGVPIAHRSINLDIPSDAWQASDGPKRKTKIYLAGSVEGIDRDTAREWRNHIKHSASGKLDIFDPVAETNHLFEAGKAKEAWELNWKAIEECDIFFCNLIPGAKSYGSLRELQKAYDLGKDIWLVRPEDAASDNSLPDIRNKFTDYTEAFVAMMGEYFGA